MSDSIAEVDKRLRNGGHGPMRRYSSLADAGISLLDLPIPRGGLKEVDQWRDKINKMLKPRAPVKTLIRDVYGPIFSLDDYLDGDNECFRRTVDRRRQAPVKIGINVSASYGSWHLNAVRGGAILAFCDVLHKMHTKYSIEICYGNGHFRHGADECHTRVKLLPYSNTIAHACLSVETISQVGKKCVQPLARSLGGTWHGSYYISHYERLGIKEFDLVLDRIDTDHIPTEVNRIVTRLKALGVCD